MSKIVSEEAEKQGIASATVNESGTTGGFKKLCANEIDVSGASRPIQQSELDACRASGVDVIELPIGYDGLAVVVNTKKHVGRSPHGRRAEAHVGAGRDGDRHELEAGSRQLPRSAAAPLRARSRLGNVRLLHAGDRRTTAGQPDRLHGSEDDTVLVRGVADDENALGYFGYAYLRNQPKLKAVAIDDGNNANGDGPVSPSPTTVANGTYQPLSRPIFIYVNARSIFRSEVDRFVTFYLQVVRELSAEVGYISLPTHVDQLAKDRYKARRTGTMFAGGVPSIGVTMDKLLETEEH